MFKVTAARLIATQNRLDGISGFRGRKCLLSCVSYLYIVVVSPSPPPAQIGVLSSGSGHYSCYNCSVWGAFAGTESCMKVFTFEVSPANVIGLNPVSSTYPHPKGSKRALFPLITQQIIHKIVFSSMTQTQSFLTFLAVKCHLSFKGEENICPLPSQAAVSWLDRSDVLLGSTRGGL